MKEDSRGYRFPHLIAVVFTFILLAGLCGCANRVTSSRADNEGKPLETTHITLSGMRLIDVPARNYMVSDAKQWQEFGSRYAVEPMPEIDFDAFTLVAVFLGQKPHPGYSVKIERAVEYRDEVLIDVTEFLPSPGMLYAQVIVYPYDATLIPKTGKQIRFATIEKVGHP
jgi:hypothetical protein